MIRDAMLGNKLIANPNLRKKGRQTRLVCLPSATPDILADVTRAVKAASPKRRGRIDNMTGVNQAVRAASSEREANRRDF